ncbi:MAG: hypothetical protein WC623_00845 [Pedobacter sp.]|uniref:hypothetical protein n=1 Tax=Pedobacter sp. TaxID=1411316 RepID=UPI00356741A5
MQTEIKELSIIEYYKSYHNYDVNIIPKIVRYRVNAMYKQGSPMEVDAIEGIINMLKIRIKEPIWANPVKQVIPSGVRRNILRGSG